MRRARSERKLPEKEAEGVVETLGHRGEGVLKVRGQTIYVPGTVPGDHVRVVHAGERGRLLALIAEGPARVTPPCPHFGACGGCTLQHVSVESYRRFKMEGIESALRARGIACAVAPLASVPLRSRRRATFAFSRRGREVALGFHGLQSHDVANIVECLVLVPALAAALRPLRNWLVHCLAGDGAGTMHVTLCDNGLDIDLALTRGRLSAQGPFMVPEGIVLARVTVAGEIAAQYAPPQISLDGIAMGPPPRAFLQPTRDGEAQLQAWVGEGVGTPRRVADLFCGLGTFALPLAKTATVHAVEMEASLLDALQAASRRTTGLKPVVAECRDLMRAPVPAKHLEDFDAVVFDPPRAGAAAQTSEIASSGVRRVVAVSCNPATFARDARILLDSGYELAWLRPLDQFLFTAHIELVGLFVRQ